MEIYALKLPDTIESITAERLLSYISPEKKNKYFKYRNIKDSYRALLSELMVRSYICDKLNVSNEDITFEYNSYGKPSVKDYTDLHFNISHSGNWVVCVFDYSSVGIDVECIDAKIDLAIAKRFFSKAEVDRLLSQKESERISYFFDLWTLKESYIKAIGKGLSIPLDSFDFNITREGILLERSSESLEYKFRQYNIDENYKLSICSSSGDFPGEVRFISLNDLCFYFLQ